MSLRHCLRPYLRLRGRIVLGLAVAFLVASAGSGRAQDPKAKAGNVPGRASGVVTKVEPINPDQRADPRSLRLTINTAAVWRDWARDQATESVYESAKKEAAAGANSVATKGEPQDKNTLVVVDLTPETTIETRFRTLDDESSKGAKTPEAAKGEPKRTERRDSAKPTRFDAKDLKPSLFIETDFRYLTGRNRAATLSVIRPVLETSTTRGK